MQILLLQLDKSSSTELDPKHFVLTQSLLAQTGFELEWLLPQIPVSLRLQACATRPSISVSSYYRLK